MRGDQCASVTITCLSPCVAGKEMTLFHDFFRDRVLRPKKPFVAKFLAKTYYISVQLSPIPSYAY